MWRVGKTGGARRADASRAGWRSFRGLFAQLQRSAEASSMPKQMVRSGEEGQQPGS